MCNRVTRATVAIIVCADSCTESAEICRGMSGRQYSDETENAFDCDTYKCRQRSAVACLASAGQRRHPASPTSPLLGLGLLLGHKVSWMRGEKRICSVVIAPFTDASRPHSRFSLVC